MFFQTPNAFSLMQIPIPSLKIAIISQVVVTPAFTF